MQIPVKIAIMSHLSDAQELVNMDCSKRAINKEINMAKAILMHAMEEDTRTLSEYELDQICMKFSNEE